MIKKFQCKNNQSEIKPSVDDIGDFNKEFKKIGKDLSAALTNLDKTLKKGDQDQIIQAKTILLLAGTRFDLNLKKLIEYLKGG